MNRIKQVQNILRLRTTKEFRASRCTFPCSTISFLQEVLCGGHETAEVLGKPDVNQIAEVNQIAAPAQKAAHSELHLVYQQRKRCARGI